MRIFIILLAVSILAGCRGKREVVKEFVEVRDTVYLKDTFTRTVVDSIFITRDRIIKADTKERSDSVVVRIVRDTIVVRKYGHTIESKTSDETAERIKEIVNDLTEKSTETSTSSQSTTEKEKGKEKKKWNFWKWLAITEGGIILVLGGMAAIPYLRGLKLFS